MRTRRQTRLLEGSKSHEVGKVITYKPSREGSEPHGVVLSGVDVKDGSVDSTDDGPPQRKKRVTGRLSESNKAKTPKRIKGKLSGVLALPVEVFMEIMRHLALPDVLSLSRSNKFFRQMLLTRSASTLELWRTAVQNVPGLPPCPKGLCEPEYATLIYSKHCSMCGTSVVRPMDPYLNVRLCKDCIEIHVIQVDQMDGLLIPLVYKSTITKLKASLPGVETCLARDAEDFYRWRDELLAPMASAEMESSVKERFDDIVGRIEYAKVMKVFLQDMADTRIREIDQLKEQRRQDVKRRLRDAGWEEPDWTFPEFVARKWASLVEAPQALTERAWKKLYPSMVPYLEKNRESHLERSREIRKGKRLRRMRRLLLKIRNHSNLLELDGEDSAEGKNDQDNPSTSVTITNGPTIDNHSSSDHEPDSIPEVNSDSDIENIIASISAATHVSVRAPFPPMVDLLTWPIISKLLKTDTDADTMQEKFEESRGEIEDQIRSWGSKVEEELVGILRGSNGDNARNGSDGDQDIDSDSEVPQLRLENPPPERSFLNRLAPATRLLLRADSVFRASEDAVAPLPLYYPEIFHILQARAEGYFIYDFRNICEPPRNGHAWDPSKIAYYPEGTKAAKALLKELGREHAAQFELQALGARFTCGSCADKWPRSWNEMIQHYAEAIAHAAAVAKAKPSIRKEVKYNNPHILGPGLKTKGKHKPIVVLHSVEEAKILSSKRRELESLVVCNPCKQLGVDFQSPRDVMLKHVRTVHSIKTPKAEHYERTSDFRMHPEVDDPMGVVSDSTKATDQEVVNRIVSNSSNYGVCVFWTYYGSHSDMNPGWDQEDF